MLGGTPVWVRWLVGLAVLLAVVVFWLSQTLVPARSDGGGGQGPVTTLP
jgi:hypothetical protein